MILVGIWLGALYWILETGVEFFVFQHEGDLFQQLFPPESHMILHRSLVVGLLIIYGIMAQSVITTRRRAEEKLLQEKQRLEDVTSFTNCGLFLLDEQANLVYANKVAQEWFGAFDQIKGKSSHEIFELKNPERDCAACKVVRTGKKVQGNTFMKSVHGADKFFYEVVSPIKDSNGKIRQIIEIIVDITEQKKVEEKLRESEGRYAKAEKMASFGHWDWNFVENKTTWSKEAYRIFDIDPNQSTPLYEDFHRMVHPADRERFDKAVQDTILHGKPFDIEYRITPTDEKERVIHSIAEVRFDKEGQPLRLVGTIHDITERKKAEEAIKSYSEQLEQSNKLKDIFIDIIRHDLLNPAGVAKEMTHLALEKEKEPDTKKILTVVANTVGRVVSMIENASIFATLEEGKKLELKEDDLGSILRIVVNEMKPLADKKNIKITLHAEGKFRAQLNPLIHDVFSNLLSNAIKYGPENSDVVVEIEEESRDFLISTVDKGKGISDEYKEDIFERFRRIEKGGVEGIGLGLAIVNRVVKAHGGRVWVEDNPEGGSIFNVTIPRSEISDEK